MQKEIAPLRADTQTRRRDIIEAALVGIGGLAVSGIFPGTSGQTYAAPADPEHGPVVTPNPITAAIGKSGVAVELVKFSQPPRTRSKPAYAMLNFLYYAPGDSGFLYCNDSRGKIWRINGGSGAATLFFDLKQARGSAFLALGQERSTSGLRSFAFHPNFARSGQPGFRKLYTANTETIDSFKGGRLFTDPAYKTNSHGVVAEWSVKASNPRQVDPASRRELFRVGMPKDDHHVDQLMFDPNATVGSPGYGKLFISIGDGGNYVTRPDPFNQAQNTKRALGKIFRIDPLKQGSGKPYGIPSDNPFVGNANFLPEIWAYGLRHPQNISFDPEGSGTFLISDIGQEHVEEINIGIKGANYGWPLREGTFVTDRANGRVLYEPPADDTKKGFTFPVAQFDHFENGAYLEKVAVTGGFVYRGSAVPALVGHYLYGDMVSGRIFHVPVSDLKLGTQATVKELTLVDNGKPTTLLVLVGSPLNRTDLRFGQGEDGEVYILTKQDGLIRKMRPAAVA
jgi:glucose/arabinose dehydrogenase